MKTRKKIELINILTNYKLKLESQNNINNRPEKTKIRNTNTRSLKKETRPMKARDNLRRPIPKEDE